MLHKIYLLILFILSASMLAQNKDLNLPEPILQALEKVGYEKPSPIQAESIPLLLEGHDLLGQAQTGTGKTAGGAICERQADRVDVQRRRQKFRGC